MMVRGKRDRQKAMEIGRKVKRVQLMKFGKMWGERERGEWSDDVVKRTGGKKRSLWSGAS